MKFLQLVRGAFSSDFPKRILIAMELIVGLVLLYLCADMLEKYREIDRYMERYADMAAVDPKKPDQIEYAKEHGTVFAPTVKLTGENGMGEQQYFGEINELACYKAVPIALAEGTWFEAEAHDCQYIAVVPYSLRRTYPCGEICELYFRETGRISAYICGVLASDLTFGNTGHVYFDSTNCIVLLCPAEKNADYTKRLLASHLYVKLNEIDTEALRILDIDSVALIKDGIHEGNRDSMAAPLFLSVTLLVLFSTALLGEYFLTGKENEKAYAIRYLCGAGIGKAVLIQACVNTVEIVIPYLMSLVVALTLKIRLYQHSTLWPLLGLIAGSILLSLVQLTLLSRKSPAQIIGRRFRQ